nr:uncharacterized protein CI109_003196 [Kwoniella shandongensis]KAA5528298.1 hypothetical protein CI109_003196 [Kwoniella shandongensis]
MNCSSNTGNRPDVTGYGPYGSFNHSFVLNAVNQFVENSRSQRSSQLDEEIASPESIRAKESSVDSALKHKSNRDLLRQIRLEEEAETSSKSGTSSKPLSKTAVSSSHLEFNQKYRRS